MEGFAFLLAVSATLLSDSCPTLYSASSPQTHRHRIRTQFTAHEPLHHTCEPTSGGRGSAYRLPRSDTQAHSWKTFSFFGWHSAISIGGRGGREKIFGYILKAFALVVLCSAALPPVATRFLHGHGLLSAKKDIVI